MCKQKVVQVIDQKINSADFASESLKKAFYKGQGGPSNAKDFLEELLEKRKQFHKYQIMKVKI